MPWNGSLIAISGFNDPAGAIVFSNGPTLSVSSNDLSPYTVTAKVILNVDGSVDKFTESAGSGSTVQVGTWATDSPDTNTPGKLDGADYEVQITYSSGTVIYNVGPALGTWVLLNAQQTYSFAWSTSSLVTGVYLLTVRDVSTMTTQDTLTLNVTLDRTGGP